MKLYHVTCQDAGLMMRVQLLEGQLPTKFMNAKKHQKFNSISDNFRL